jgi:hypothetical protein
MNNKHQLMVEVQKHLIQLQSADPGQRFSACEELRLLPSLPDHAIEALHEKTSDPNYDVADAATRAIELHRPQAAPATLVIPSSNGEFARNEDVEKMYKSIRSWAIFSVILGGLSIVAGDIFNPVWGIVLITIGILSWKVKIPQMFIIYSVIMGWAAIGNTLSVITGGGVWWLGLSLLQVYLTVVIIKDYRKYRKIPIQKIYDGGRWPEKLTPPQDEMKIVDRFAISSFIGSAVSIAIMSVSLMSCLVLLFITGASSPAPEWLFFIGLAAVDIAVLTLGMGIAALVSKNNKRGLAIGGIVISSLVLFGFVIANILIVLFDEVPAEGLTALREVSVYLLRF